MVQTPPPPEFAQRLQVLEDRRAIVRTLFAYGHCLDYGDEAGFMDCFAADGELGWSMYPQPLKGHDQIRAGFRRHTHAPDAWHKHMLVQPQISVDGDSALVRSMFFRLDPYISTAGPEIYAFGRYVDTLVRCADGHWRIRNRIVEKEAARAQAPALAKDQGANHTPATHSKGTGHGH